MQRQLHRESSQLSQQHYGQLFDAFEAVKAFFYGDGQGIPFVEVTSDIATSVLDFMVVSKIPTNEAIEMLYIEQLEAQENLPSNAEDSSSSGWGWMTFKVFICGQTLHVYVMNCRQVIDLKPLPLLLSLFL